MANSTLNGFPVMQARISRPRVGNWVAELALDAQVASQLPAGASGTLVTDGGALTFQGIILPGRADAYAQNVTLRMVGGSNGLGNLTTPRFYAGVSVSQPLGDVLKDAQLSLSSTASSGALGTALQFWALVKHAAALALTNLADAVGGGCVWRVLPDGSVFFGVDTFQASALVDFELIDYMPLEGLQVISSEAPDVNPGESFNGRNVSTVVHEINADGSRIKLWYEP